MNAPITTATSAPAPVQTGLSGAGSNLAKILRAVVARAEGMWKLPPIFSSNKTRRVKRGIPSWAPMANLPTKHTPILRHDRAAGPMMLPTGRNISRWIKSEAVA